MGFLVYLTYLNTDWCRAYQLVLKFKGNNSGTWELPNANSVPWGLLAYEPKGTFTFFPNNKQVEFYSHQEGDSAGVNALSFVFYDAPKSRWDKATKTSDGLVYGPKNPAGEECDLTWQLMS